MDAARDDHEVCVQTSGDSLEQIFIEYTAGAVEPAMVGQYIHGEACGSVRRLSGIGSGEQFPDDVFHVEEFIGEKFWGILLCECLQIVFCDAPVGQMAVVDQNGGAPRGSDLGETLKDECEV